MNQIHEDQCNQMNKFMNLIPDKQCNQMDQKQFLCQQMEKFVTQSMKSSATKDDKFVNQIPDKQCN